MAAILAFGMTIKREGVALNWKMKSVSGIGAGSRERIEVPHLGITSAGSSTTFGNMPAIPGFLVTAKAIEIEMYKEDASVEQYLHEAPQTYELAIPELGKKFTFEGWVSDISDEYPMDNAIGQTVTIERTDATTISNIA